MSDAPNVYMRPDGIVAYRASALGGCLRGLTASRMGMNPMDPPAKMQAIFAEGHLHEPSILDWVCSELGAEVVEMQQEVELPVGSACVVVGHTDGTITRKDALGPEYKVLGVECKSMSEGVYSEWLRVGISAMLADHERYAYQLSAYMLATGLPWVYAIKNRNNGQMVMETIVDPPRSMVEIERRVLVVELAGRKDVLPSCDRVDFPCPFFYIHEARDIEDEEILDERFKRLARELAQVRDEKRGLETREREIRRMVMEQLGEPKSVRVDDIGLTWAVTQTSRFDTRGFKADHPDTYAAYQIKGEQDRVTIRTRLDEEVDHAVDSTD